MQYRHGIGGMEADYRKPSDKSGEVLNGQGKMGQTGEGPRCSPSLGNKSWIADMANRNFRSVTDGIE